MARPLALVMCAGLAVGSPGCAVGRFLGDRAADLADCFRVEVGAGLGIGAGVRFMGVADVGLAIGITPRVASVGWRYGKGWAFGLGHEADRWDAEIDLSAVVLPAAAVVAGVVLAVAVVAIVPMAIWLTSAQIGNASVVPSWDEELEVRHRKRAERETVFLTTNLPRIAPSFQGRELEPPLYPKAETDAGFAGHYIISGSRTPTLDPDDATEINYALLPVAFTWISTADAPRMRRVREMRKDELTPESIHALDIEATVYAGVVYVRLGLSYGEFLDFLAGWVGLDPARDDRFNPPAAKPEPPRERKPSSPTRARAPAGRVLNLGRH